MAMEKTFRVFTGTQILTSGFSVNPHGMIYNIMREHKPKWILMQSVGVKDKNGTRIFEGDIVKHVRVVYHHYDYEIRETVETELIRIGKISLTAYKGVVLTGIIKRIVEDKPDEIEKYRNNPGCWADYATVIGNIHKNPELLAPEK